MGERVAVVGATGYTGGLVVGAMVLQRRNQSCQPMRPPRAR